MADEEQTSTEADTEESDGADEADSGDEGGSEELGYKLAADNGDHVLVQHPEGHTFPVAKDAVGPTTLQKILNLPKAMLGVTDEKSSSQAPKPDEVFQARMKDVANQPLVWDPSQNKQVFKSDPGFQQAVENNVLGGMQHEKENSAAEQAKSQAEFQARQAQEAERAKRYAALGLTPPPQSGSMVASAGATDASGLGVKPGQLPPGQPGVPASAEMQAAGQGAQAPGQPGQPGQPQGKYGDLGQYGDAFKQQAAGINQMAGAQAQQGKEQEQAYKDYLAKQEAAVKPIEDQKAGIMKENQALFDSIKNGKVDPHRYFNNMSTGNKILATIGLILGGSDAGDNLMKLVDRDIDSQKADLNNKHSLMSMNMQRFRDMGQAETETRLQMNTVLQAQLQMAAAKAQSPVAQANAKMALGNLDQQANQLRQQLAQMRVQGQSLGVGGSEGGLPLGQEPYHLLSDPKYQEKRIVVNGKAFQASSPKDAEDLKNLQSEYEPVRNMVSELTDLRKDPSVLAPGSQANNRAQAIRSFLIPRLNKLHGLSRLSEEDVKLLGGQISDPSTFRDFMSGKVKNDQFMQNLNEDIESNYKSRLIGYQGLSKYKSFKPI